MQKEILATHAGADLEVYAVWFTMIRGDKRRAFDAQILTDERVTHLWDEEHNIGRWFAQNFEVEGCNKEVAWDVFFVFEPDAAWKDRPESLVDAGAPIWTRREDLRDALEPLLSR